MNVPTQTPFISLSSSLELSSKLEHPTQTVNQLCLCLFCAEAMPAQIWKQINVFVCACVFVIFHIVVVVWEEFCFLAGPGTREGALYWTQNAPHARSLSFILLCPLCSQLYTCSLNSITPQWACHPTHQEYDKTCNKGMRPLQEGSALRMPLVWW